MSSPCQSRPCRSYVVMMMNALSVLMLLLLCLLPENIVAFSAIPSSSASVSSSQSLSSAPSSPSILLQPSAFISAIGKSASQHVSKTSRTLSHTLASPARAAALSMNMIPKIDDWEVLKNGRVVGTIFNHPSIPNGDTITTSPISRPELAAPKKVVTTISGNKYQLGTPGAADSAVGKSKPGVSIVELQRRARVAFDLNGEVVGDESRQYLLAGNPTRSTSGKSQIYKAYQADEDGLPTGTARMVKISRNWEAIEREAENYAAITKAGFWRGQFVELLDFLPEASSYTRKFRNQSALVMERGVIDLKRYVAINGRLESKRLRDAAAAAAQCLQAVHGSGLVWTDLKTENFVVDASGQVKGIDLESAMPVKGNPVDYSPEGTPPEFARAFLAGDGPYFILQYNYDIWSFGMLLYEMSTGRGYFEGKSPVQITKTLRDGPNIDLREVPDPQLRNLIGKCLLLDPRRRNNILQILLHPYFLSTGIGPISF